MALLTEAENKGTLVLFGGVKHARFKRPVTPGDVLQLECTLTARRGAVGMGKAVARVDGVVADMAELTFALA